MADQKPVKVIRDTTGNTHALGEFTPDDAVAIVDGGTGGKTLAEAQANLGIPVFGQGFSQVNEFSKTINTGTGWLTKATLTFPVKAGATYRIGWQWMWRYDSISFDFEGRITLNGNQYILHKQEPQDSSGSGTGGSNQALQFCGFDFYGQSTDGTITLEIQWRSSANTVSATIWEARIEQFRVN